MPSRQARSQSPATDEEPLPLLRVGCREDLPAWASRSILTRFFHECMKPYHDEPGDIERALDYAFEPGAGQGGFLVLASQSEELVGALLMLRTGMGGYVPGHLLLFVAVHPDLRGRSLGTRIIEEACRDLDGAVKLHVEYDNPAKRLYERLGFASKYAEMRYEP